MSQWGHIFFQYSYDGAVLNMQDGSILLEKGKNYKLRYDVMANLDVSTQVTAYIDGVEFGQLDNTTPLKHNWVFFPRNVWGKGKLPIWVSQPKSSPYNYNIAPIGQIKNLKLTFNPYEVTAPEQWIASPNELTLYDYAGLGGFSLLKDYALSFDFQISEFPTTEQTLIRVGEFIPCFLFFRV